MYLGMTETKAKRNTVWGHLFAVRDKSKPMEINYLQSFDKNNAHLGWIQWKIELISTSERRPKKMRTGKPWSRCHYSISCICVFMYRSIINYTNRWMFCSVILSRQNQTKSIQTDHNSANPVPDPIDKKRESLSTKRCCVYTLHSSRMLKIVYRYQFSQHPTMITIQTAVITKAAHKKAAINKCFDV